MRRRPALLMCLLLCVGLTAFSLSGIALGVTVTSDADQEQPVRPMPPMPVPPSPPPATGALARYIDRLEIEGPYAEQGLVFFTLTTRSPETGTDYLTLDEGIASGQIIVQEAGGGSVPMLRIRNLSGRWAFLMAGEIVSGGKQNRTVKSDTLLPPRSKMWIDLPVYCVEQHRWSAGGKFDSAKAAAPNAMRSGLNQGYDQGAVWRESQRAQESAGVKSETGDVTSVYSDAKNAKAVDETATRIIGRIPRREYVGLVVARGNDIVSVDIFADGMLYAKLYEKVIRSHVVECLGKTYAGAPTSADVRSFLNRIRGAGLSYRPAPGGVGQLAAVNGDGVSGESIEYESRCIHAGLFPQIGRPIPVPMIER